MLTSYGALITFASDMSLLSLIQSGGWSLILLLLCSLVTWAVILERIWSYRRLGQDLKSFHLEALNQLLTADLESVRGLCRRNERLPTAAVLSSALERLNARDLRLRNRWREAAERRRQLVNQDLRRNLWILGTIGSAAPFIGLFGTVIGILRSFGEMAKTGAGGFAVVAAGISESLIATAAGIIVAVISVMAYNIFQTRCGALVLMIRLQAEEFVEVLAAPDRADTAAEAAGTPGSHGA